MLFNIKDKVEYVLHRDDGYLSYHEDCIKFYERHVDRPNSTATTVTVL